LIESTALAGAVEIELRLGLGLVRSRCQACRRLNSSPKRLELLKEAVPRISRVLVLSYLSDPIAPLQVAALDRVAPSLGVTLFVRDIRSSADIAPAFDAGVSEHVDGVIMTAESVLVVHGAQISEFAARLRLPAVYPYVIQAKAGGLMAYEATTPSCIRMPPFMLIKS
jgi:putative ABC transport system substrate-binding protein